MRIPIVARAVVFQPRHGAAARPVPEEDLPRPAPPFRARRICWAKDGDANTAHSQTVGPLPYHGMPQYPYAAPHRYPDDSIHREYLERYVTRQALRLIRPLTEGTAPARVGNTMSVP